jgi:hypothetical protein
MKTSQLVEALKPLFAADTKPEAVTAAIASAFALDRKAKDEAEEKAKAEKEAADKAAADKAAADKAAKDTAGNDLPGKSGEDGEMDEVDGEDEVPNMGVRGAAKDKAMDAAISAAVAHALAQRDAAHAAREAVKPVLGVVALDSAEAIYKAALDKLGVETKGVDATAYRSLFEIATKQPTAAVVGDAAPSDLAKAFPHFNRLSR